MRAVSARGTHLLSAGGDAVEVVVTCRQRRAPERRTPAGRRAAAADVDEVGARVL